MAEYPLEGWIALKAEDHQADTIRGGCKCGFAVWSPAHVAIMAYRDAVDAHPVHGAKASDPPCSIWCLEPQPEGWNCGQIDSCPPLFRDAAGGDC